MLGKATETDLRDKFFTNVSIDWNLKMRQKNQDVSKYFLPHWTATDAEQLLDLNAADGPTGGCTDSGIVQEQNWISEEVEDEWF